MLKGALQHAVRLPLPYALQKPINASGEIPEALRAKGPGAHNGRRDKGPATLGLKGMRGAKLKGHKGEEQGARMTKITRVRGKDKRPRPVRGPYRFTLYPPRARFLCLCTPIFSFPYCDNIFYIFI